MGKYTGILLCTDFDNTMYNGKIIPKNNLKAIKYFTDNGGLFTVISGRSPDFLIDYMASEDLTINAPLGNYNGAVIYDAQNKKILREGFLNGITKKHIDRIFEEIPEIEKVGIFKKSGNEFIDRNDLALLKDEHFTDLYKVTFRIENDKEKSDRALDVVRQIVGEKNSLTRSGYSCIEIVDPSLMKGGAVRFIKEYLGATKLVCVGDFENDISMVEEADIGYAVANAVEGLKLAADRITVSVNDGAIAHIIEEL